MRRRSLLALAATGALGLAACGPAAPSDLPDVMVTTNVLGDVVAQVLGEQARVTTLMQANADPHSFEISVQQAASMGKAALVVSSGLGLEAGLQQHLDRVSVAGVPRLVAGDCVEVLSYTDGDSAGNSDPHFWTDPQAMIEVVNGIEAAAAAIPGINTQALARTAQTYRGQLEQLDADMVAAFAAIPDERRALVTNHHVFGYLAHRYGFRVIGAVIPGGTTLAAPSAADLRELSEAIRQAGVSTIFAESSQPDRLVQVLASESGLDVQVAELFTESLTGPTGAAPNYLQMMRVNTERISTGLAPTKP